MSEEEKKIDNETSNERSSDFSNINGLVKFEVYGREMVEKKVKLSGNSGRVYLPPDWVNHRVKIIRMD